MTQGTKANALQNQGTFIVAVDQFGKLQYAERVDDEVTEEMARKAVNDHINQAAADGYPGAGRWVVRALYMWQRG